MTMRMVLKKEAPGILIYNNLSTKTCERKKMNKRLQDKIVDAFVTNSEKETKIANNGTVTIYEFISFSGICKHINSLCIKANEKYPGPRVIRRELINLIDKGSVVEMFGEPPVYFLFEEFNKYKM